MDIVLKIIGFLLTIGIVVTWHELGHYWAAKWAGVKVQRFSIGFGPVIKRWTRGADKEEWVLSAIPMGGYVKMLDEHEDAVDATERARTYNAQPLYKRSIIVAAGPFANFVLAIVFLALVNLAGVYETRAIIDVPTAGSAAASAGLQAGDEIVAVNGQEVDTWNDARWAILLSAGSEANITAKNARGALPQFTVAISAPKGDSEAKDPVSDAGLMVLNPLPATIGGVNAGSAAQKAGLQANDEILAVDGKPIQRWVEFANVVSRAPNQTLSISLRRQGQTLQIDAIPAAQMREGKSVGMLGIRVKIDHQAIETTQRLVHYSPLQAIAKACARTWELSQFTLKMLGKILLGQASLKNISGPVAMADYAGQSIESGYSAFLAFIALISISIGVLNLLPIPMLDGGHLLYHAFEAIFRTPPSLKILEWGQRLGVGFVVALMSLAFYNDITRYFIGR